ncbi:MAG: hypothetical protein RO257_07205 [Candidatus Kapabacteria bacterium]|nr:hypothetical protein [Candidatus Kapabacteria bacterium]
MQKLLTILPVIFLLIVPELSSLEDNYYIEKIYEFPKNTLTTPMDMSCFDNNNCIMISTDYNGTGVVAEKTSDGGQTWQTIYADTLIYNEDTIYSPKYLARRCKYFSNGTLIIFLDMGKVLRSENFGESFEEFYIENYDYQSFEMIDINNAITVSAGMIYFPGSKSALIKSTDGCKSWQKFNIPDSISERWNFETIGIQEDKSLIIGCYVKYGLESDTTKRYYFHTDFEGSFWKSLSTEQSRKIENITLFDENEGIATGRIQYPKQFDDSALVLKTYNGGKDWEIKLKTGDRHENFGRLLIKNDSLFMVSGAGFGFYKSTDKGESWFFPKFEVDSGVVDKPWFFTIYEYFEDDTFYSMTSWPSQLLKGKKINTSVDLPSVKPKKLYPNPVTFGSTFTTDYEIERSGFLKVYISDVSGKVISPLYSGFSEAGSYSTALRLPDNISSGSYWLVLEQNGYLHVQMLNVVK